MATHSTVENRIRTALGEYLKRKPSTITREHSLRDDLGLDSMATIELLFKIEETFDLQIPDQDLQRLSTVGDVIDYVEERLQDDRSAPSVHQASQHVSRKKIPSRKKPPRKKTK